MLAGQEPGAVQRGAGGAGPLPEGLHQRQHGDADAGAGRAERVLVAAGGHLLQDPHQPRHEHHLRVGLHQRDLAGGPGRDELFASHGGVRHSQGGSRAIHQGIVYKQRV